MRFPQITCDPSYSRWTGGGRHATKSFAAAVQAELARGDDITQSHERIPGCMIFRAGDGVHAAWLEHRARVLGPLAQLGGSAGRRSIATCWGAERRCSNIRRCGR